MNTNTEVTTSRIESEAEICEMFSKLTKEKKKLCMSVIYRMVNDPEYNQAILNWDGKLSTLPMP